MKIYSSLVYVCILNSVYILVDHLDIQVNGCNAWVLLFDMCKVKRTCPRAWGPGRKKKKKKFKTYVCQVPCKYLPTITTKTTTTWLWVKFNMTKRAQQTRRKQKKKNWNSMEKVNLKISKYPYIYIYSCYFTNFSF